MSCACAWIFAVALVLLETPLVAPSALNPAIVSPRALLNASSDTDASDADTQLTTDPATNLYSETVVDNEPEDSHGDTHALTVIDYNNSQTDTYPPIKHFDAGNTPATQNSNDSPVTNKTLLPEWFSSTVCTLEDRINDKHVSPSTPSTLGGTDTDTTPTAWDDSTPVTSSLAEDASDADTTQYQEPPTTAPYQTPPSPPPAVFYVDDP